jgi:integrase
MSQRSVGTFQGISLARRLLQNCGQIMRYGGANDLVQRNPVADVKPADILKPRKKRNYPRVKAREMPQLLRAIDGYVGGEHTRLGLQLMALTFLRTSELIGARWPEFDMKQSRWDIPAERMKMKTPHTVPSATRVILLQTAALRPTETPRWEGSSRTHALQALGTPTRTRRTPRRS